MTFPPVMKEAHEQGDGKNTNPCGDLENPFGFMEISAKNSLSVRS